MIEKQTKGEQNSTTYQEIRLQVDIKGQLRQNADQKPYSCPTIVFWAKISKKIDFQVFRNFGEIF